jgi:hypothetical protein
MTDSISPVGQNYLASEKSPYLLQHKDNPVWWHAWGEEAFKRAAAEDKPIFLSIGYSTCYWCHVMEHDSFESAAVAAVLNQKFISIKVDREERPDVDQVYMDAVVALTGHGGWPMTVFLTPDRKPFWGGTFFPRAQFLKILEALSSAWENDRAKVLSASDHILSVLTARAELASEGPAEPDARHPLALAEGDALLQGALAYSLQHFDEIQGGFSPAPKFPPATHVSLILRAASRLADPEARGRALSMASLTLSKMAYGGIFDHLGGGFHRYSTDDKWLVPHFEKMLYDNSLLAVAYLEAAQVLGREDFAHVARDTLDYLLRDMQDPAGGFYSAEDAGEVEREGEFYVWREAELKELLTPSQYADLLKVHPIPEGGNFEHGTVILTLAEDSTWAEKSNASYLQIWELLLAQRAKRKRPLRDEKILCGWNGLAIAALAKGHQVLGDSRYLRAAQHAASRILKCLRPNGTLFRSLCGGEARHKACLEDYAYLIEGLLQLYRSDFNSAWIDAARELQREQDEALWDEQGSGYYFSASQEVPVRKKDYLDNATPSAAGVTFSNLLMLGSLFQEPRYHERAQNLLSSMLPVARRHPTAVAKLLCGVDMLGRGVREVKLYSSAPRDSSFANWVRKEFLPQVVISARPGGGEEVLEICEGQTCLPKAKDSAQLRQSLLKVPYLVT